MLFASKAFRVVDVRLLSQRLARLFLLVAAVLCAIAPNPVVAQQPIKGEYNVSTDAGFLRIVFRFAEEVESEVRLSNNILVIGFKTPVDIGSIDRLPPMTNGYASAARRDPDGRGVRIALNRRLVVNSVTAAEQLFVDLLPDTWTGPPPGLPLEVVQDLARRAREAEKKIRQQRAQARERQIPLTRVRVAHQPKFTRYIFELSESMSVEFDRSKSGITLTFDAPLKFDLSDAKGTLPPMIEAIDSEVRNDTTLVKFNLLGKVEVRGFREDVNYVVDVGVLDGGRVKRDGDEPSGVDAAADALMEALKERGSAGAAPPPRPPAKPANAGRSSSAQPANPATPSPSVAAKTPDTPPRRGKPDAQEPSPDKPVSDKSAAPPAPEPPARNAKAAAAPAEPPAPPAPKQAEVAPEPPAPRVTPKKAEVAPEPPAPPVTPKKAEVAPEPPARPTTPKQAAVASEPSVRPPAAAEEQAAVAQEANGNGAVTVALQRQGDNLRLVFPFHASTPAAAFQRGDTLWLVFDSRAKIDVSALDRDPTQTLRAPTVAPLEDGQVVRLKLDRPRLVSASVDGTEVVVLVGETVVEPPRPLNVSRNLTGTSRLTAAIAYDDPRTIHRVSDPEMGDTLFVVTSVGPARSFLKTQEFVEFRALASIYGVVVQPLADDLTLQLSSERITISRPTGLMVSIGETGNRRPGMVRMDTFDAQLWGFDRDAPFRERERNLINAAADAPDNKKMAARIALARFYLARDLNAEAKGVLDVAISEERTALEDPTALVLRAVADILIGRNEEGLKDLSNTAISQQPVAQLWRAVAQARQGNWGEAHDNFRNVQALMTALPLELQRFVLTEALRAAVETKDYGAAANQIREFETLGLPSAIEGTIGVITGRIAEGLGRSGDALGAYRVAVNSTERPAAAQARLRETVLRYQLGDLKRADVISELETLTTIWRGDQTEIEALQILARLYTEEARYREAFRVMRTALMAHPNSDMTRRIQEEAAATFDSLFLAGKGDALPALDALSLFYDYRELTPIGRRGDEMIRRLADRLVAVDLLDQATELLQHQVDHRLQGAGRAQVASRLAVIYLMARKPDKALAVLRNTRSSDVSNELRSQRLLIEARALSDIGRPDIGLEVIANLTGREAMRLRADILWAAKRWREASEQIELLYGERWLDWQPLTEPERADLLRAAVGYTVGDDMIGSQRFREKYAAKMAESPDRRAFEIATSPSAANSAEFREVARLIASGDTLEQFLRDMRARYPETGSFTTPSATPAPSPPAAPRAQSEKPGSSRPAG
jgi:tetratricopeptide (TPR) repeat protein